MLLAETFPGHAVSAAGPGSVQLALPHGGQQPKALASLKQLFWKTVAVCRMRPPELLAASTYINPEV